MTFQVPMIEVAITVTLAGMDPAEHFIYLHPVSELRDGPETLQEYLNGTRTFFPMLAGGVPKMVNRDQILWVSFSNLTQRFESQLTLFDKPPNIRRKDGAWPDMCVATPRPAATS